MLPQHGARPVYNLTVEKSHLYYANSILVHNCDSMSQALAYLLYSSGIAELPEPTEEERIVQGEVQAFLDADTLFNPYGDDTGLLISRQGG